MEPQTIVLGKEQFVKFIKTKGYKEQVDYFDSEYTQGTFFEIRPGKLLVLYEVLNVEEIKDVRNHFLRDNGLSYCVILFNKKVIFFRNFGDGRYFLYSERTQDKIGN